MVHYELILVSTLLWSSFGYFNAAEGYEQASLQLHNELRAKHKGTPPMELDNELNQKAVECAKHYLKKGKIDHSCEHKKKTSCGAAGENLFYGMASNGMGDFEKIAKSAINAFYNEKEYYNYETGESTGVTGHFTQLVWVDSTKLGAGIVKSQDEKEAYAVFLYCNHGNVVGAYVENVKSAVQPLESSAALPIFFVTTITVVVLSNLSYIAIWL